MKPCGRHCRNRKIALFALLTLIAVIAVRRIRIIDLMPSNLASVSEQSVEQDVRLVTSPRRTVASTVEPEVKTERLPRDDFFNLQMVPTWYSAKVRQSSKSINDTFFSGSRGIIARQKKRRLKTRGSGHQGGRSTVLAGGEVHLLPGYRFVKELVEQLDSDGGEFVVGAETDADELAEKAFYRGVESVHVTCDVISRLGNTDDGGWNVCLSNSFALQPGTCVVYSFGINNDFSFDDAASRQFGCSVYSFDPSMSVGDYTRHSGVHFYQLGLGSENTVTEKSWKLMTFGAIRRHLRHTQASHRVNVCVCVYKEPIDLVKIDIDYSEWQCLRQMLADDVHDGISQLHSVKQLLFEIHTPELVGQFTSGHDYDAMWSTLVGLELLGFRRFDVRYNPSGNFTSPRTGQARTCCYDLGYVNMRYANELHPRILESRT